MLDQLRHKDTVILISYTIKFSLVVKWSFMAVHNCKQIMADK